MASIRELHQQLIRKERSAVEITQETLNRITQLKHSFFLCDGRQPCHRQGSGCQNRSWEKSVFWDSGYQGQYVRKNSYNLRLTHTGELCAAI